jgi:hypothetical protein
MADKTVSGRRALVVMPRPPSLPKWGKIFLSELAVTSNVSAAARKAKIHTSAAYDMRRANPEFARKWQEALCEGYDHLELELLHRLRTGEVKPASGARRGVRSFDNGTAFRLLSVHRDAVSKQRAINSTRDAAAIIVSINTKLETMRQRWLIANGKTDDEPGQE